MKTERHPTSQKVMSKFTQERADYICKQLSEGVALAWVLRENNPAMWGDCGPPHRCTVGDWRRDNPEFDAAFKAARQAGAIHMAERVLLVAQGVESDTERLSTGDVQRDKLVVDTTLKLLAHWFPLSYGQKVQHVGGGEDDAPIRTETKLDVSALTEEQLRALSSIKVG